MLFVMKHFRICLLFQNYFEDWLKQERQIFFFMIDRLIRLVLTLPVSTATTERAFSTMKIVKTTIRNKMGNDFLADSMIIKAEKELVRNIDMDSIIDDFYSLKDRKVQLK